MHHWNPSTTKGCDSEMECCTFLHCRKPMSINSWCLIPKNHYLARVLTHLLSTDPYQLHIDCQAYQCKQKKLGFSILLGLKKELWPIQNPKFQVHAGILLCKSKVEISFYFSYNPKPTLRLYMCAAPTNRAYICHDPSISKVLIRHKTGVSNKMPFF